MPIFAAAALPFTMSAIGAGAAATGAIVGANKQSSAVNHAADLQSQSAAQALQFEREQAARDQANFEATQRANYDQWASREGRLGTLDQLVGLPQRQIPGYVPTTGGQPGQPPMAQPRPPARPPQSPYVQPMSNLVQTPQLPYQAQAPMPYRPVTNLQDLVR